MSTPPPSEARLRAEARKAKIQARGADRLAKLANTARGEEGAKLYEDAKPLAPRPAASTNDSSSSLSTVGAPIGQQQQQQGNPFAGMEEMFPGFSPSPAGGSPGGDPFAAMLQAMQAGGGPGASFPGAASGNSEDPFADPFAAMLSSMGGGGPGGAGRFPAGFGQQQLEQPYTGAKTRTDRLFDLAHVLGVVGLVLFVLRWWEPAVWAKRGGDNFIDLGGYDKPAPMAGVKLPVFWAFVTISLILQTSRALLFRSRPPPSKLLSLASPFLPLLPPRLKTYLFTASRYLSVGTQFVQDLSLLVFLLGVARWVGGPERVGNIVG